MCWIKLTENLRLRFYKNGPDGSFVVVRVSDFPLYQYGQIYRADDGSWIADLGKKTEGFPSHRADKLFVRQWLSQNAHRIAASPSPGN